MDVYLIESLFSSPSLNKKRRKKGNFACGIQQNFFDQLAVFVFVKETTPTPSKPHKKICLTNLSQVYRLQYLPTIRESFQWYLSSVTPPCPLLLSLDLSSGLDLRHEQSQIIYLGSQFFTQTILFSF